MPDTIIITPSPAVEVTVTPAAVIANTPGTVTVSPVTSSNTLVVSPIINTGTPTGPIIGINQSLLAIAQSQVAGLVTVLTTKSPIDSPTFTGVPAAPTATAGTNTTQIATTEFVGTAVSNLVNAAPATLNTLNELATALGNDASFATTVTNSLADKASLASANAFTVGGHTITNAADIVPLSIIPFAGQSSSTFRVRNSANNADLMSIDSSGQIRTSTILNPNSFNNSRLQMQNTGVFIDTGVTTNVPLAVRGSSGQTADLLKIQNNSGTDLLAVNNAGSLLFGSGSGSFLSGANGRVNVQLSGDNVGLTVRAFGTQTADLVKIQNSSGVDLVRVDSVGRGIFPTVLAGALTSSIGVQMAVQPTSAATPGFAVRGAASQTADLQQWQESNAGVPSSVNAFGQFRVRTFGTVVADTALSVHAGYAAEVPIRVRGAASQSGNLFEIQNSASSIFSRFDQGSNFYNSNRVFIGTQSFTSNTLLVQAIGGTTETTVSVRANSNLTGNLISYESSSSVVLGGRNAVGQTWTGSTIPIRSAVGGTIQSIATGANPLVTMGSAHNLAIGDLVTLAGTSGGTYDGTYVIVTTPASTTFTVTSVLTSGQAFAQGTASVPGQVSITARSSGTTSLIIRGLSGGQAAPLQQWLNTSGGQVGAYYQNGTFVTAYMAGPDTATTMTFSNGRNVQMFSGTASYGGGAGVMGIANATTVPTSNPTGGGILYADTGDLKYRDPNGAITPISFTAVAAQSSWTGAVSLSQTDTMGTYILKQLTGSTTVTIAAGVTGKTYSCTLELQQDTTGSRTIILKGVKTAYGVPLTLTTTASATDIIRLEWNGGSWTAFMSASQTSVPSAWV